MARLINEDELIKNRVDDYLEKSTSQYTKFLETTPNFVTYYQYDNVNSTMDKGLEDVENYFGSHSPNKFNKIEKFPLYGMDTMSVSQEFSEVGMDTNYESEALILPNTIRPYPGDYFRCDYIGEVYLFRITGVQNDTIRNKPFYRVSFSLYKKVPSSEYVDEFVSDEYVSIFDNIGGRAENIIAKSDYLLIDQIDAISAELIKRYTRNFYDKNLNVISLKCCCGAHLYNRHLTKFIMDNELFKIDKGFRTDFYLTDINDKEACMFQNYKRTIYYALEKKTTKMKIREFGEAIKYNFKVNQFTIYGKPYVGLAFRDKETETTLRLFPKDFIKNINEGRLYTKLPESGDLTTEYLTLLRDSQGNPVFTKAFPMGKQYVYALEEEELVDEDFLQPSDFPMGEDVILENIIIEYMNGTLKLTPEKLDAIMDLDFDMDMYCYSMVPLFLFVLKQYKKKLTETIK